MWDGTYLYIENPNDSYQFLKYDWKIRIDLVGQYWNLRHELWFSRVHMFKFFKIMADATYLYTENPNDSFEHRLFINSFLSRPIFNELSY